MGAASTRKSSMSSRSTCQRRPGTRPISKYPRGNNDWRTVFVWFSPKSVKVAVLVVIAPVHGQSYSSRSWAYSEAHAHDALSTGGSISSVLTRTMARKAVDVGYDTLVSVGYKQIRYDFRGAPLGQRIQMALILVVEFGVVYCAFWVSGVL